MPTLYLSNKYKTQHITPVFFLSPGRTGTKWICYAYNQLFDSCLAIHEAPPMIKPIGLALYSKQIRDGDAIRMLKAGRGPNIQAARDYYKKKLYIEANHNLFNLATHLRKAFPGCVLFGMTRDVRTWIPSMANRGYSEGVPWFSPPVTANLTTGREKLAWYWINKTRAYLDQVDGLVKYEAVCSTDPTEVAEMFNKITSVIHDKSGTKLRKVTASEMVRLTCNRINSAKRGAMSNWELWTQEQRIQVMDMTWPLMKHLGYTI